jgi:hypothetical protein
VAELARREAAEVVILGGGVSLAVAAREAAHREPLVPQVQNWLQHPNRRSVAGLA